MSDALLWNELGNLYLKLGSRQDAIAAIARAVELDPDSGWFHYNLGHAYMEDGDHASALFLFHKAIRLMDTPKDQAMVWNEIGNACRALKDIDNAIHAYKMADDLGKPLPPPSASAAAGSPSALLDLLRRTRVVSAAVQAPGVQLEDIRQAVAAVEAEAHPVEAPAPVASQEFDPSTMEDTRPCRATRSGEAAGEPPAPAVTRTLLVIPDPNGAPEDPASSAAETPQPAAPLPALQPAIENLEEILAKVHVYENITRANPGNDRAWDTLGRLYKSLGRFQDAIHTYQQAVAIAPEREVYSYYLGLLFAVEGQHEQAVHAFERVLEMNPDYILAHGALAGVYHRMGLENKANHHISIALPSMNNESAYNRACFYAICGDSEHALECLQDALKNNDTTIEWMRSDPDLDPIRTDPRFHELLTAACQPLPERIPDIFSSGLETVQNRLLPVLNQSLVR